MFSFPSHPLPLNEDYGKEFFPNNIKNGKWKKWKISAKAIKSFQSVKTPGLDGRPVKIYQAFFDKLKAP